MSQGACQGVSSKYQYDASQQEILKLFYQQHHGSSVACLSILSNEEKPICLSYEQLWIKVDELKRKLAKFLRKDTKLMITICHSMGTMEEIIAVCACLTLPVIVIPLDPSVIPKVQFLQTLKELQISVILGLSVVHALVLDHSYRYIITSDDDDHHLDMYVHEDAPFSSPPCFPYPLMCPKARQSCCYILYTSGSTGRPKGVCGSYAGLFHRIQNIWTRCPFVRHQDARVLRNTQLGFIDSWNEIFSTLLAGKSLVLVQNSSCSLIERIGKSRITRVTMVPSLFQTLCHISSSHLNHPNDDQRKSRPTSFVLQLSGETCPPALLAQARDFFKHHHAVFAHMKTITILNLYGTTETAGDNALRVYEIKKDGEFISPSTVVSSFSNIGSPFGQNVMLLMNVDDAGGTPREISSKDDAQVGEVWISGPQVALGYVNQKEQSQIYFIDYRGRRYFRTGDYGQWQKEGESAPSSILFHGRQDDQIKIRGHRLDILDIETTCSRIFHHVVKIVPVHKEENAPPVLIALVVMSKAHEEVEEWFWNWQKQLKSIAGLHLSPVAMPSFYIPFRSVLPQLSSGKIDRLALKEYAVKEMQARVWRAPTGGMEQFEMEQNNQKLFQEIVERITKVKVPSDPTLSWMDKHSFEDLGGTSLDAIVFLSEINRCWQLQLQPADVIHVPLQSIFDTVSRLPASEQPQRATKRHKGMLDHDDAENNDKTAELQIKWKVHGKKCIDASALIIESKNLLVIGSHSRDVFAIDLDSGDVRWQTQVRGRVEASATVDALVSHVYLGCYEGHVYAFVLDSGTLQWTFQTGATIKSSPAIDPVSHVLWCGSYDHYIYGLCPESGSCFYRLAAHGSVYASPIFDLSTQIMVSATTAGRVMAHRLHMPSHDDDDDDEDEDRLSTLDMLWQVDMSAPVFATPAMDTSSNVLLLYVAQVNGTVSCIRGLDGSTKWHSRETDQPIFSSPTFWCDDTEEEAAASSRGGRVVFGAHDGILRCLEAEAGRRVWSKNLADPIYSSPVCFESHPQHHWRVGVCTIAGQVVVLDLRDGSHVCTLNAFHGQVFSSPRHSPASGGLVIGCRDNYIYHVVFSPVEEKAKKNDTITLPFEDE